MAYEDASPRVVRKYLENAYSGLLRKFGGRPFRLEEAARALGVKPSYMKNLLSELKRRGWLISKPDPEDARRAVYNLDLTFISEMKTEVGSTITSHEGEYVLFVNGRIVDKDHDVQRLLRRALKKHKPDEIYITNVGRPRELVTIGF
ncbi:MAG: MarR family transcriptional regulator [Crenarchaeota archaeon]|nr:MarR family transcriptional regulator [Thermoproteota archaeon]